MISKCSINTFLISIGANIVDTLPQVRYPVYIIIIILKRFKKVLYTDYYIQILYTDILRIVELKYVLLLGMKE